jgi:ketol-acid reductoisomerase
MFGMDKMEPVFSTTSQFQKAKVGFRIIESQHKKIEVYFKIIESAEYICQYCPL